MQTDLAKADDVISQLAYLHDQAQAMRSAIRDSRPLPQVNWVTIAQFSSYSGYSAHAINAKRKEGVWLEGEVWKKAPDNRILISLEGYNQWVEKA